MKPSYDAASNRNSERSTEFGSAALFAATAHPDRIASVIVGTGGAAFPLQLGEPLASWVLDPDLDKYRRMDSRGIVGAAVDTIAGGVPDHIRAQLSHHGCARFSPPRYRIFTESPPNGNQEGCKVAGHGTSAHRRDPALQGALRN